jgi:serine/threonine-protein kinase
VTDSPHALSQEQFNKLEVLFEMAVPLGPADRDDVLRRTEADDPVVARELAVLLQMHDGDQSLEGYRPKSTPETDTRVGMRVGAFVVGKQIGIGGMGTVHEGTRADAQYSQRVAIKFLRRSADDAVAVGRFRAEQQFLASLQHPNIAALLDGGVTPSGTPYFVMEYIDGAPIDRWCDERHVSIRDRVILFRQVCLAVRAAHQRLVVHRDLKPGNILITENRTAKLLDFGIAKLLGDTDLNTDIPLPGNAPVTVVGQQAFTPEYAAPEQIRGEPVDIRADIYALGVVLFELLSGQRPISFRNTAPAMMAEHIRSSTVPRLDSVVADTRWQDLGERSAERVKRKLAGDLDAIAGMALRHDLARRYPSVDALLEDIDRYLDGRPVTARPDGAWYHVRRFVARHALETGAGVIALASLVTGVVVSQQQARRAESESARAREVTSFLTTMLRASNPESFGKDVTMRAVLDSAALRLDEQNLSPILDAEVRSIIGGTYLALGEFDLAQQHLAKALAERQQSVPGGDYETAVTLSQLSLVHESNGQYEKADSLLRLAEHLYVSHPHPDVIQEVSAMENRARILSNLGRNADALPELRRAFELARRRGRADDPAMASTYINAAVITSELGENEEADSLAARGFAISQRAHGDEYPLTLAALEVRAGTLERIGNLAAAESTYRAVMAGRRRVLGPTHPEYAFTLFNLSDHLLRRERWAEAADLARQVLALRGVSIDDTHPAIAVSMQYLGRALGHMDSLPEGERWMRESLALRTKNLPSDHWLLASSESALGEHLVLAKRYPEAEQMLLQSEKKLVEKRGEKSPVVRDARTRIVKLYEAWGRKSDADRWRERLGTP